MLHLPSFLPNWLWFVAAILAAWRITSVLNQERIGYLFRRLFGFVHLGEEEAVPDTFFGHLIACFWCLSFWVSVGVVGLLLVFPYALLPFAVSAGAILLHQFLKL